MWPTSIGSLGACLLPILNVSIKRDKADGFFWRPCLAMHHRLHDAQDALLAVVVIGWGTTLTFFPVMLDCEIPTNWTWRKLQGFCLRLEHAVACFRLFNGGQLFLAVCCVCLVRATDIHRHAVNWMSPWTCGPVNTKSWLGQWLQLATELGNQHRYMRVLVNKIAQVLSKSLYTSRQIHLVSCAWDWRNQLPKQCYTQADCSDLLGASCHNTSSTPNNKQ